MVVKLAKANTKTVTLSTDQLSAIISQHVKDVLAASGKTNGATAPKPALTLKAMDAKNGKGVCLNFGTAVAIGSSTATPDV